MLGVIETPGTAGTYLLALKETWLCPTVGKKTNTPCNVAQLAHAKDDVGLGPLHLVSLQCRLGTAGTLAHACWHWRRHGSAPQCSARTLRFARPARWIMLMDNTWFCPSRTPTKELRATQAFDPWYSLTLWRYQLGAFTRPDWLAYIHKA